MSKKILITGGSRGIGLEIAKRFLQEKYEVIICARGKEGLEKVKEAFPEIQTYQADLSDKAATKAFATKITQQYGRIDVLVNNAGLFIPGQIHLEKDEVFEQLMKTNLNSAYYLTKALLPPMIAQKTGTIINMCSIASITPYPNGGSYSISKYALLGFSKCLREELKPYHIRVVSLLPGAVYTSSWEGTGIEADRIMPAEDIATLAWASVSLSDRTVVEDMVIRPQLGDL